MFCSLEYLTITHHVFFWGSRKSNKVPTWQFCRFAVYVSRVLFPQTIKGSKAANMIRKMTKPVLQRLISYPEAELLEGSRAVLGAWGRLNSLQHLA